MDKLIKKLRKYAEDYRKPPYGMEVDGTPELLEQAADSLTEIKQSVDTLKQKFIEGLPVKRQGDDADDGIECPNCGYEVARNDDYREIRPKHCPECGTKLIY